MSNDAETVLLIQAIQAWNAPIGQAIKQKIENLESQLYYQRREIAAARKAATT